MRKEIIRSLVILCFSSPVYSALAKTQVVVIPIEGDEIRKPFEPVTPSPLSDRYYVYTTQHDTVIDTRTKLEWQRYPSPNKREWLESYQYCENLTLDGKSDWRMPYRHELQSIVDYSKLEPATNSTVFVGTYSDYYWSASRPSYDYFISAFRINFTEGSINTSQMAVIQNQSYVRCVRK